MKVLIISHDPYMPMDSGQRQRTARLIDAIQLGADVKLLFPGMFGGRHLDCPKRRNERWRMLHAMINKESIWVARFRDSEIMNCIQNALCDRPDLIVCAGLPSAFLIPDNIDIPIWIDEQNVEWRILDRALPHLSGARRWIAKNEITRLKVREEGVVDRAQIVTACSDEDASLLKGAYVLHNVCGDPELGYFRNPTPGKILFTGTMEWGPNVDAACWMAKEILPLVRMEFPEVEFRIVGRNPSSRVRELTAIEGVNVVGSVASIWPELSAASISVAPIRMGSGTRIKILEAASGGVPVVSTTIGAEGLGMEDGKEILLADSVGQFANACISLLQNADRAAKMGEAARHWRDRTHSIDAFNLKVKSLLEMICS